MKNYVDFTMWTYADSSKYNFGYLYVTIGDGKLTIRHELSEKEALAEKENLESFFGRTASKSERTTIDGDTVTCYQIYGFVN